MGGLKGGEWGLNTGALAGGRTGPVAVEKVNVDVTLSVAALLAEPAPQGDKESQLSCVSAGSWSQQSIVWALLSFMSPCWK